MNMGVRSKTGLASCSKSSKRCSKRSIHREDFTGTPLEPLMGDGMFRHFRPIFRGKLIASVGMTAERGSRLITEGFADLVAFGRPYIANPDLVERLATGAPLAEVDWKTVYASGPRGYSDYPAIRRAAAE